MLQFAVSQNAQDANARLHLGNLYAALGRLDDAVSCWQQAAKHNPKLSMAFRNLGLHQATVKDDLPKAQEFYNKAIADAQAHMHDRVGDLDGSCYEPEFGYWKR